MRLQALRNMAGISARELDRLAHLTEGHTRLIEKGVRPKLEVETVEGLADALGATLDWLVRGLGPPPSADTIRDAVAQAKADRESGPLPVDEDGATGTDG